MNASSARRTGYWNTAPPTVTAAGNAKVIHRSVELPPRHLCTKSKNFTKVVTRHIWSDYVEIAEEACCTPTIQRMYKARKETIERVFADAKEQH